MVELAKEWRTDRVLRHLEALLLVADKQNTFLVSGTGDVIEPDDQIAAIGSGGYSTKAQRWKRLMEIRRTVRAPDCRKGHDHRGEDLHLYQRKHRL